MFKYGQDWATQRGGSSLRWIKIELEDKMDPIKNILNLNKKASTNLAYRYTLNFQLLKNAQMLVYLTSHLYNFYLSLYNIVSNIQTFIFNISKLTSCVL